MKYFNYYDDFKLSTIAFYPLFIAIEENMQFIEDAGVKSIIADLSMQVLLSIGFMIIL